VKLISILILAVLVTIAWFWNPGKPPRFDTADVGLHSFKEEVYGDAVKPACCRVLVPYICRAVNEASPGIIHKVSSAILSARPLSDMRWDLSVAPAYLAAAGIAFMAFVVVGLTSGKATLVLAAASIGPHVNLGDPVTIAAFSTGIFACSTGRHRVFWLAFAVASLNRETAPLMLIPFVLSGGKISHGLVGLALFTAWRVAVVQAYADNDMDMLWFTFVRNVKMISPPSTTTVMAAASFLAIMLVGMSGLPSWMRYSWWTMLACLVVSAVLFGQPERMRMWGEVLPLAAAGFSSGVNGLKSMHWSKPWET